LGRRRSIVSAIGVVLTLVASYLVLPVSPAAAAPGITLTKSAPGTVRAGAPITYRLTAANPVSNPDAVNEWNLSFRDVLPPGLTYVAGSTTPTRAGEPTAITDATGSTTLVWSNVADIQVASSFELAFEATPDPTVYPVGSTVPNTAQAYTNSDPLVSPEFDDSGVLVPDTATESAADDATTLVSALEITKSEPSPEGELLRGVHDHTTVYELTVRASEVGGTAGVVVTDYLPAQLEYLGCGGDDFSAAPEYPGAPPLSDTPAVPGCVEPDSVTTVTAAGTTLPSGIYTRLVWTIGVLAADDVVRLPYAAGIPLRANALFPIGTAPDPESGEQGSNLDNNTGAPTREGPSEQSATNHASVVGDYQGPVAPGAGTGVSDSTTATVSIEDLRMRKSVSPGAFQAGGIAEYDVVIDASEYTSGSNIVVTDVVPAGLCPLGGPGTNYVPGAPATCAGSAATTPSSPFDSVTSNPDGSFTVVFDPVVVPANGSLTISYAARMLSVYLTGPLAGEPTAVGDSFTNHVSLAGSTTPIAGTGETGTVTVNDTSSATLTSGGAVPNKTMLPRSESGGTCSTDGTDYDESENLPADETRFRAGDLACFKLRVDFSSSTQTRNPQVVDFLPPGFAFVAGSVQSTSDNTAPFAPRAGATYVAFDIGTAAQGGRYVLPGAVFEVVIQALVLRGAPGPADQVRRNLMKLGIEDTAGVRQSFRDTLSLSVTPPPPLRVVKGVEAVDVPASGPNGPNSNVDGVIVEGGSVATFRIDVNHAGTAGGADGAPVGGLDVWDVLAPGLDCSTVSNVRFGPSPATAPTVTCTDPDSPDQPEFTGSTESSLLRVTWELAGDVAADEIAPGERFTILYDVTVPDPADVSSVYPDTAHVRRYQQPTNVTGPVGRVVPIFPKENVDPTVLPLLQTGAVARDASSIRVRSPLVTKTGTTSITEQNNNTPDQATVGELLTYRYSVVIPAGTEVNSGSLADTLPSGIVQQAPATLAFYPDAGLPATGTVPAGVVLDPATGRVTFGPEYANDTDTDQRFEVLFPARVTPTAITATQNAVGRTNTARFESLATAGGDPLPPVTAAYTVNLRQPRPTLAKTTNQPAPVPGGTLVTFTLTAANVNTNNTSTNRPPLHDTFLVDCLPAGLLFEAYGANPGATPTTGNGANGCAAGTTRLVWALGDVAAGPTVTRTYTARLPLDAVAGDSYTNTAQLTGSSLDDNKTDPLAPDNPLERTYSATAAATVTVSGTVLVKTVTPDRAPVGDRLTWRVTTAAFENTSLFEASLIDRIPSGIDDVRLESVECIIVTTPVQSCGAATGTPLTPVPQPDGSTLYGWTAGDVVIGSQPLGFIVTYSGRITDQSVNVAGRALVNSAHSAWNITNGRTPTAADFPFDRTGAPDSATAIVLEPRLSVAKAVSDATPDPTQRFSYTVRVTNATGATVSAAHNILVTDAVPVGVVVDPSSISAGGELTGADPVTGGGTITWDATDLPGPVAPGVTVDLGYEAVLAPSSTLTAAALVNTATVRSFESLPTGGRIYTGPSTTARVTPQFPRLTTTKAALDPAPAYIGDPFRWRVTVTNSGGSTAFGVDVVDTLPEGWEYVEDSARVVVSGGGAQAIEPVVLGRLLAWNDLGSIANGESVVVSFSAVPTADVVTDPGVGASVPQVNSARGTGVDSSDAPGNATGPYSGPAATATTRIGSADLVVDKTHVDPFVAGGEGTWRVAVRNAGPDVAVGPFEVTDTLPAGVTLVSATGTGWSCAASGADIDCTRLAPGETLAVGASLPVVTVVVAIPDDTAPGTTLSNSASVTGRTYDPQTGNNTASDTATVTTSADLRIDKHHALDPIAGESVTWALDVANDGPSVAAAGTVVTDTLPDGLTYDSATGEDWSCDAFGQLVTCTRTAPLPVGAAPQITLVADVASSVTDTIVNTAEVTGPTPDPDTGNNTDTDSAPVVTNADLSIEKTHVGPLVAGATGTYQFVVVNSGPSDAAAPVRITDALPDGLTYTGSVDVEGTWSCSADGQDVTCDLAGGLAAGDQATVRITVAIDPGLDLVRRPVTNTARVTSPTTDPNPANNVDSDVSNVDAVVDLAIVKSHTGTAVAGEDFDWTLTVTNNGPSTSPAPIVVTDVVPAGTSFVSATGTGWSCSEDDDVVRCERDATLTAGDTAPPITVTLLVLPASGPGTITNLADVEGPAGDPDPANNTDRDTVVVRDQADVAIAKETVGSGVVDAGGNVAFDLTVTNNGPSDADRVIVHDELPTGTTAVSVTPPDGEGWLCAAVGREVACARATLPAQVGGGAPTTSVIRVVARVDASVPVGTVLTNTVTVSTATPGDDPDNNTATSTVEVEASADLVLTKTHDGGLEPVRAGTTTSFTIAVENDGPSDAQGPLTVTDTLPDGFSFVSAAAPWVCAPSGGDPQVVDCETPDASPLVAGGTVAPLVITVAVDAAADQDTYTNTATVESPTPDPDTDNNTDTAPVRVVQSADLSIVKTHSEPVRVGDDVTFTLAVANAGPSEARFITVVDTLPDGLTYVSASGDGWTCDEEDARITCELPSLAPGESAGDITVVATVEPGGYPTVANTASIMAETTDPDTSDNSSTTTLTVPPLVDLAVTKSHTGDLAVGTDATWTLSVTNDGPTDDPGPITVADTVPSGLRPLTGTGDGWSCALAGQVVTCTDDGGLAMGATSTITLTTAVLPSAYPSVVNTATVTSPAEDTNPENNAATDIAPVEGLSTLVVDKELTAQSDGRATFRIIVTNEGPNDTTAPIVVTDPLPEGMTPLRASGPGWSCGIVASTVTCQYPDAVVVDDSTTPLTVEVAVTAAPGTALVNVATAGGGQPNPCPTCVAVDDASLVVPLVDDNLAQTGSDLLRLLLASLALLGVGAVLVGVSRASRTSRS
jgi:uncharacterized repeat protein (TIGR01451 family)